MVQELSSTSPLPYTPYTSPLKGNIDSLKDCPLTSLNLEGCYEFEGMSFGYCEPSYPPRTITLCKVLRPQGLTKKKTVQELSPISPLPYAPPTSRLPGNIDSLKDCPLTSLNLEWCTKLEGITFGYCEPIYPPRTITLYKVLRPQAIAQRTFPETFSISSHPFSAYPIFPGDIEVFKDMPLIDMDLAYYTKLTGVVGLGWGMVGGVKIRNRLMPQLGWWGQDQ